jgi:hypothetical protein
MQCVATAQSTGRQCKRWAVEDSDRCGAHQEFVDDASLSAVASTGDRLSTLRHLRQTLSEAIDAGPPARDLAALSRRLQVVLEEVAALDAPDDDGSSADEVARKRERLEAVG